MANTILKALLEITIYSIVIFLTILLIKKAFHSRMSFMMHYCVWFILVLRLVVPVTIETSFNFVSLPMHELLEAVSMDNAEMQTEHQGSGAWLPERNKGASIVTPPKERENYSVSAFDGISWQVGLLSLFAGVAAIMILRMFALHTHLLLYIRKNSNIPNAPTLEKFEIWKNRLRIRSPIKLVVYGDNKITTPALIAAVPPIIVLPENTIMKLDDHQLDLCICHELSHYKFKDHIMNLLLSLLSCIYWFNPIIYLAKKMILRDMELRCDHSTLSQFSAADKRLYANTLLSLGIGKHKIHALGMSSSTGKKALEERIVGIFSAPNSSGFVRMLAILIFTILLLTCFTTACQPTPEASVIIVGDDSKYLEPASQGGNPLTDDLSERYEGIIDVGNKNVKIKIDASVIAPVLERYAVFSARPEFLSQAMVDKARAALIGDKTMYDPLSVTDLTQEEVLIRLNSYKQAQAELQGRNESSPYIDDMIAFYEEKLKAAPVTIDRTVNDGKFGDKRSVAEQKSDSPPVPTLLPPGNDYNRITASVDLGNETLATFSAYRSDSGKLSYIRLENTGTAYLAKQYRVNRADIEELSTTFSKAKSMAQEVIKNIGLDYMEAFAELSVTAVNPVEGRNSHDCYLFIFTRGFNGLPAMYHKPMLARGEASAAYAEPWADEYAAVTIDDAGIVYFTWESPTTVKMVNESVALLSFDRIMEFLAQHCRSSLSWIDESIKSISVEITQIRLCMAKISTGADEYLYVPAWDFIGISQSNMADGTTATENGAEQSYFTINAIDGSIIDRNLGY
mgnify:CR=1 FL=1